MDAHYETEHREEGWEDVLDEIYEEIELAIQDFEDTVYETSIFQPKNIEKKLETYIEQLDVEDFFKTYDTSNKLDGFIDELNDSFNNMIKMLRKDLSFENLELGLRKRITPSKRKSKRRKTST